MIKFNNCTYTTIFSIGPEIKVNKKSYIVKTKLPSSQFSRKFTYISQSIFFHFSLKSIFKVDASNEVFNSWIIHIDIFCEWYRLSGASQIADVKRLPSLPSEKRDLITSLNSC